METIVGSVETQIDSQVDIVNIGDTSVNAPHASAETGSPKRRNRLVIGIRRMARYSPLSVIGGVIFLTFVLIAVLGPLLTPYDPIAQDLGSRLKSATFVHPFGTDNFGRDILSRIIYGARNMFVLTGAATLLSVGIGLIFGLVIGYSHRLIDEIVMRIFDSLLAMPALLLTLLLLGSLGSSRITVLIATVVLYVPIVTRVVRGVVIDVKTRAYVEAAEVQGESRFRVLFREILPAVLPTLAVEGSLRFSYAIFLVASLGFLGVGVSRPEPDWGLMVGEAREWYSLAPWLLAYPSVAIVVLVISINLFTDGLRYLLQNTVSTS